jgi:hypothetical protein
MYTIALAYCGTASNKAIRRLLHVAVSDVSDDVRRAAVTALGFVLLRCAAAPLPPCPCADPVAASPSRCRAWWR